MWLLSTASVLIVNKVYRVGQGGKHTTSWNRGTVGATMLMCLRTCVCYRGAPLQMSGELGFNDNTGRSWNTDTSWSDAADRISYINLRHKQPDERKQHAKE